MERVLGIRLGLLGDLDVVVRPSLVARRTLVVLVLNPHGDEQFTAVARRLLEETTTVATFELELRRIFPRARVHRRILSDEFGETWYVYRDGTWIPEGTPTSSAATRNAFGGARP